MHNNPWRTKICYSSAVVAVRLKCVVISRSLLILYRCLIFHCTFIVYLRRNIVTWMSFIVRYGIFCYLICNKRLLVCFTLKIPAVSLNRNIFEALYVLVIQYKIKGRNILAADYCLCTRFSYAPEPLLYHVA